MLEVLRSVFRQNVAEVLCVMDPLTLAIMVQSVLYLSVTWLDDGAAGGRGAAPDCSAARL